jgi:AcrR family transcriptional regulator
MKQQSTKNSIAECFYKLLNERYFDKITIRDIVEECGVTRNTFYYYFEDVYDIIDDTLNREMKKVILAGRGKRLSLEHLLEPIVKFFTENQNVAVHLFKSSKKD